jgi:hypothetical protein
MAKKCGAHLNKAIFPTVEMAERYMRSFHPLQKYEVYPCPAFQRDSEEGHYHTRNKIKRNKRKHLRTQRGQN